MPVLSLVICSLGLTVHVYGDEVISRQTENDLSVTAVETSCREAGAMTSVLESR